MKSFVILSILMWLRNSPVNLPDAEPATGELFHNHRSTFLADKLQSAAHCHIVQPQRRR